MRILHTGDWHLGARLGSQDRTGDQMARLSELCDYVDEHEVDLLLVAGDVFDEHRSEPLGRLMHQLARLLRPRVEGGLTCVFLAGNHDREYVFPLLRGLQSLVSPDGARRVLFADTPRLEQVRSRRGEPLNVLLLPYPSPSRYELADQRWPSPDQKRADLASAARAAIRRLAGQAREEKGVPAILCGHFLLRGVSEGGYLLTEQEDIPLEPNDLPSYAYVALGHIHRAQSVGAPHIRYCGGIDRLDRAEAPYACQAVLVELTGAGLAGIEELPLQGTPFAHVAASSEQELEDAAGRIADLARTLVSVTLSLGRDQGPAALLNRAVQLFPRMYNPPELRWLQSPTAPGKPEGLNPRDIAGTVATYLRERLAEDEDRDELVELARGLLTEVGA